MGPKYNIIFNSYTFFFLMIRLQTYEDHENQLRLDIDIFILGF